MGDSFLVYLEEYYIPNISLKHRAAFFDVKDGFTGLGEPDKQVGNIGFYYSWKDLKIKTFEEWQK